MKLCVLIPTWKRLAKLKVALRSLALQSQPPERVIVVTRDIDTESTQWVREQKQLNSWPFIFTHLIIDIPGVIAAENLGLVDIDEDIVAFLDDDAEAPPDWIKVIKDRLQDPSVVAIGGPDYIVHEKEKNYPRMCNMVGEVTPYGRVIGNHHQLSHGIREVKVLKGVNMAFRRDAIPLLDTHLASEHHLGNGSQWELDLCFYARKKGKLLFDSNLRVNHYSDHSHFDWLKNQKNNAHNITYVMLKHLPLLNKILFILYIFFIGNHQNIGILKALSLIPRVGIKQSYLLFINSCIGAFFGLKTYLEAKK